MMRVQNENTWPMSSFVLVDFKQVLVHSDAKSVTVDRCKILIFGFSISMPNLKFALGSFSNFASNKRI